MSAHRPPWELGRAMEWGPLEQYEPTLSSSGSQPSGQTVTGRFRRYGSLAFVSGVATLDAVGTGGYRVSLPSGWAAATITGAEWVGDGGATDVSASVGYRIKPYIASAGTVLHLFTVSTGSAWTLVTSSAPFAMGAGDRLTWSLWLELDAS